MARRSRGPTLVVERELWDAGDDVVVGVDEVGRGAWAGPLTIGAAVLPRDRRVYGVRDSKQLTEIRREQLFERVGEWCVAWAVGHWMIVPGAALAFAMYYGTYEYVHWCMHLPKARRVEKSWFFYRLNGHHLLHHRYMHKNFNVVFPLADLCLGTLILRSKTHFAQATGPSVPNVQPR